jgi:hypothetical protein
MSEVLERARAYLFGRRNSFRRTFNLDDQDDRIVLEDLSRFCRAHASTGDLNPQIAARLDGRREVWLRIQQHLNLTDEQLWKLYNKGE